MLKKKNLEAFEKNGTTTKRVRNGRPASYAWWIGNSSLVPAHQDDKTVTISRKIEYNLNPIQRKPKFVENDV